MTNLFLTSTAADAEVTAGSGTKWKAAFSAGASARHLNRNSTAAANPPIQMTDGATAGTDGTVVAWYTEPLAAVSIAGAITVSIWDRENANANNVAPTIRIERCDGSGTVLSTIVSETVNHGAGEMATTAGGVSDSISVTAADVTDTTLADGDRLRITLWIDDASDQGGSGSMASGGRGEMWVNGPVGAQGQALIAFTEDVGPVPPDPTGQVDYVDSTTTGATAFASSRNVPMPSNTTMDVVVVEISRWNDPAINPTITNGGGFTQVSSAVAPDGKQRLERFVKRLSAPMTSNVTFTWTGSMWTTADATCYRGVDRDVDLSTLFTEQVAAGVTTFPAVSSSGSVSAGSALHWHGTQENSGTSAGPTSPAGMTVAEDTDADQIAYLDNVAAGSYTVSGAVPGVTTNVIASLMVLPPEPAAGGAVTLTVDAATQAHTSQTPTLTQTHTLSVAGAGQAQTAASPSLSQTHVLTAAPATQTQAADSPTLVLTSDVVAQSAAHAQSAEEVALTQVHVLAVSSAAHSQAADTVALSGPAALVIADATQGQTSTSPALTQIHQLTPASATQPQTATSPVLTQVHVLAVDGALHGQTSDTVSFTSGGTLVVQNATQAHAAGAVVLIQQHSLTVTDAAQAQAVDLVELAQLHLLQVASASQAQLVETLVLEVIGAYTPADTTTATVRPYFTLAVARPATATAVVRSPAATAQVRSTDEAG